MSTFDRAVNPQPLLRDGSLAMSGDLDLNGNDLLDAGNMDWGTATVTFSAAQNATFTITLNKTFPTVPTLTCQVYSNSGDANGMTFRSRPSGSSGSAVVVVARAEASITGTFDVHWQAFG